MKGDKECPFLERNCVKYCNFNNNNRKIKKKDKCLFNNKRDCKKYLKYKEKGGEL